MKRATLIPAPLLGATLAAVLQSGSAAALPAGSAPEPRASAASRASLAVRHSSLGSILVSSSGRTVYEFTRDRAGRDSCVSISGCAQVWPPLRVSGRPSAASGVRASLLSTVALPGGGRQLTYAGHPLYLYSADSGPAETYYVGASQFGGRWLAVNATGRSVG